MLFPPGITVVLTVFCGGDGARSGRSGREAGGTAITTWAAGPRVSIVAERAREGPLGGAMACDKKLLGSTDVAVALRHRPRGSVDRARLAGAGIAGATGTW